jgi:hypothetical protein
VVGWKEYTPNVIPFGKLSAIMCIIGGHVVTNKLHLVLHYPAFHVFVHFGIKSPRSKGYKNFFDFIGFITIDNIQGWRRLISPAVPLMLILRRFAVKHFEAFVTANTGMMCTVMASGFAKLLLN